MHRRITYANVTATLALVLAMSGGAVAANHYLVNSTKQISPKVLKKLTGKTGKAGKPELISEVACECCQALESINDDDPSVRCFCNIKNR